MVAQPNNPAPAEAAGIAEMADADRTQGLQSLGSHAAPSLHAEILAAFAADTPLPEIITTHKLTLEDLHAFLSSPGIPEQLEALRTLTNFSEDLQSSAGRQEGTAYLRQFLKDEHEPVEKRRAATALLRGPARTPTRAPVNPDRKGGARPDISDWIEPPPDDDIDEDIDDDLDTDGNADLDESAESTEAQSRPPPVLKGGGVRGSARTERGVPVSEPALRRVPKAPTKPIDIAQLPLTATPDDLISHQLSLIQTFSPQHPTPRDILHALDFHRLSFPIRAYADLKQSFLAKIPTNLLDISNAELTPDPATIHDTTPPTATVRVRITHPADPDVSPDAQSPMPDTSSILFHLRHESTFPNDPNAPHAWHTTAITEDTS